MTYPEAIKYLESFVNYEKIPLWPYKKSLKLERVRDFLQTIGNPHDSLKCIHIAGSKGKGSTCAFIAYILREAGYKTGLYTSPHLSDFRERIRILEKTTDDRRQTTEKYFEGMISKKELADLVQRLKPQIDNYNKKSEYGLLSFFEVWTALALVYFKEEKTDFVVLETGLGGRLDATNTVNPYVCVITPISHEHMDKLGNTLTEIAKEKVGIIKEHQSTRAPEHRLVVISAPQKKEVMRVIKERCRHTRAKLYRVGKEMAYKKTKNGFNIQGALGNYSNLKINLLGRHQLMNASAAAAAVKSLGFRGVNIGANYIRQGLYNTVWPGRCEVVGRNPYVVLDGAQNIASIEVLKVGIKDDFKYNRLILVLGISNDKDIKGICRAIIPSADCVILTQADNPRAASVDDIEQIIRRQKTENRRQRIKTRSVKEAMKTARDIAKKEDLILVTGSLFVVGQARTYARR